MSLFFRFETIAQFGSHFRCLTFRSRHFKNSSHPIGRLTNESVHFTFAFHNQADCHRLHTSGRECGLHFTPKHRRKLKPYDTVEHTACLLSVHQVHVDVTRVLNSLQNSRFRDFMENDTLGLRRIQFKHFEQMP